MNDEHFLTRASIDHLMVSIVLAVSFLFQSLPLSQLTPSTNSSISYAGDASNQQLTLGNKSMTYEIEGHHTYSER